MTFRISESLEEYNKNTSSENLNESFSIGGKLFRELFLNSMRILLNSKKYDHAKSIYKWAKHLKALNYPKLEELKDKLGTDYDKFERLLGYMQNLQPKSGVNIGGGYATQLSGSTDIGESPKENAAYIAKAFKTTSEAIVDLITKK